jgi:hypothetical protein
LDPTKVERVVFNALTVDAALPPDICAAGEFFGIAFGEVDPPWRRLCFKC